MVRKPTCHAGGRGFGSRSSRQMNRFINIADIEPNKPRCFNAIRIIRPEANVAGSVSAIKDLLHDDRIVIFYANQRVKRICAFGFSKPGRLDYYIAKKCKLRRDDFFIPNRALSRA